MAREADCIYGIIGHHGSGTGDRIGNRDSNPETKLGEIPSDEYG
jgi:hypothetical protein